jgi:hypothetical protein
MVATIWTSSVDTEYHPGALFTSHAQLMASCPAGASLSKAGSFFARIPAGPMSTQIEREGLRSHSHSAMWAMFHTMGSTPSWLHGVVTVTQLLGWAEQVSFICAAAA